MSKVDNGQTWKLFDYLLILVLNTCNYHDYIDYFKLLIYYA